jgi:hypothetical protein
LISKSKVSLTTIKTLKLWFHKKNYWVFFFFHVKKFRTRGNNFPNYSTYKIKFSWTL